MEGPKGALTISADTALRLARYFGTTERTGYVADLSQLAELRAQGVLTTLGQAPGEHGVPALSVGGADPDRDFELHCSGPRGVTRTRELGQCREK
jgi:hypothetical protein